MFPPLKSAVGGLITCLDIVQVSHRCSLRVVKHNLNKLQAAVATAEDYGELTSELTAIAGTLNQYLAELGSEDPNGSAARIAL